jgi:soluble lytic murein transglycosylase-like protein
MSTIASLISLIDPSGIKPWYEGQQGINREVIGRQQAQTGLIELQQLKEKQAAEQEYLRAIQQNPALAQQLLGGSTIAGLPTMGGPPGAGPMMQQSVTPAQPPGAPQVVPGGQDLSQFATQGGPPQSVLGSLGPQPQGPMQPQQNPVLAMARANPRAALMLQQQMQAQQDRQWKMQEQRLDWGVKTSEYVARMLQGVTDQATLDEAREAIRQVHPQAASQVPQMYSKAGIEQLQQKGVAIAERAKWDKDMATARKTQEETRLLPELFKDVGTGGMPQAPTGEAATAPLTQARTAPPEYDSAITEANRLYPQVKVERIKSIIAAESNFDAKAVSSAGAKGPMQLMDATATDMGVDDPFDVQQNVRGGTRYYAQLLTKYGGDERKALTAYNWGPGNLDKVGGDVSQAPPETQAYVAKVLGGGGAAGTSTGTAPSVNPRVPQLDTMIQEGTRKAKQAAVLGYEGLATQYNNDVQRLQHERDRLDAPRQEFLKKQAVAGIEKDIAGEQGRQAAQIKADTEPASKEEIDAVNRSLPPDKRVPYGTTRKQLREQGRIGGELLSPKVTEDLTNTTTAIQQFEELSSAVAQLPTGPLTQYVEGFKERWGIDISDAKVAQRAILAGATNQLLQARSGAAINESEYQRLLKELPNEGNDPKVFKARLANTVRQFKNLYKTKVQILRKTGHAIPDDLMEPLAAPEGPPAQKVSSVVDKFKAIKP